MDKMDSLGVKANEMSAIFPALVTYAMINAKQIRIGAIDALSQRNTYFGYGNVTAIADGKSVFTGNIVFTFLQCVIEFYMLENSTTHENMFMAAVILFNLFEAFINPINAIFAVDHRSQ